MNNDRPKDHQQVKVAKTGVLLISLGTPEELSYGGVRRYLKEFLSDRRVIEVPRLLWWFILNGPILTFRPMKSLKNYRKIWNNEQDESPLRTIARDQGEKLDQMYGDDVMVRWAFRYGNPSIKDQLEDLRAAGCQKIILFALYPQYSASTIATAYDKAFDALKTMRWQPAIRTTSAYFEDGEFIEALADTVNEAKSGLDWQPDAIVASYHSLPKSYWEKGDPYPCQCLKTSRLLRENLGMSEDNFITVFQSRFGTMEWVGPQADTTLADMASRGIKKVMILAPAFSSDCLETLEEVDIGLRETFLDAGGTHFEYIPCLNAGDKGMALLKHLTDKEGQGWL